MMYLGMGSELISAFNCHILLCSPTATNTISLNNLVFVGRDVLGSCLCDEKNDSLYTFQIL